MNQMMFLTAAYITIWVGLFLYILYVAKKLRKVERDMELIEG